MLLLRFCQFTFLGLGPLGGARGQDPNAIWSFFFNFRYWKCLLSPLMLRAAALFSCIMSILIIWSEVTFFSRRPTLSVFAAFVNLFSANRDYFAIEVTCLITIFYLSLCAYYTIFKIRVLNYYYLAGNHQSDEYTLLFSGALLCR